MSRRSFLVGGSVPLACFCMGCSGAGPASAGSMPHEARFYDKLDDNMVQCRVCPRECVIQSNERGYCGTRENRKGVLYSLVYGVIASRHVDPIEKKPFFHVLPGSRAYSIATAGCNMECKFCQNWQLSQAKPEDLRSVNRTPSQIAESAGASGSVSIAYTYNEPTVFTEFVYDCAAEAKKQDIHSVVISNGYVNADPIKRLSEVITAYKVDLKSFSQAFYRDITGGERDRVLDTIKLLHSLNVWVEIVHLTIPTLNDDDRNFTLMADWLAGEVGRDVPVHFTRFHPMYKLTNLPPTPVSTLERARDILMDRGMRYVYVGNVPGHPGESTYCPSCGKIVVERGRGYSVGAVHLKDGACGYCGTTIPGVWM